MKILLMILESTISAQLFVNKAPAENDKIEISAEVIVVDDIDSSLHQIFMNYTIKASIEQNIELALTKYWICFNKILNEISQYKKLIGK